MPRGQGRKRQLRLLGGALCALGVADLLLLALWLLPAAVKADGTVVRRSRAPRVAVKVPPRVARRSMVSPTTPKPLPVASLGAKPSSRPKVAPRSARRAVTTRPEALCTIPFASNQWWLDGRRKQLIVRCSRRLSRREPVAVLGHTDINGVPRRNRRISRRRAYTVAHVLRREGRTVTVVRGLGARTPRCDDGPRRARCNRRVEVWSMAALRAWKKAGRPW